MAPTKITVGIATKEKEEVEVLSALYFIHKGVGDTDIANRLKDKIKQKFGKDIENPDKPEKPK